MVKIPRPSLYTKITQRRKLTRRYFMSCVIVDYNSEGYCHAFLTPHCLPTSMYDIVENKFKTRFFSVFLSFSLCCPFIVDRASQRDRQYDSWLCVKYTHVHARIVYRAVPVCACVCVYLCVHVPVCACTCVLANTCITGILLSLHLL